MTFKVGEVSNPKGRPVGSENKLNSQIKRRISSALKRIDKNVLDMAIKDARPNDILGFLSKLAPKDLNVKHSGSIAPPDLSKLTKKQLEQLRDIQRTISK